MFFLNKTFLTNNTVAKTQTNTRRNLYIKLFMHNFDSFSVSLFSQGLMVKNIRHLSCIVIPQFNESGKKKI